MEQTVICLLMVQKFKAKDFKITAYPLCLESISKDWSTDNMKKTRLKDFVYDFSVNYNAITVTDILDIPTYLMKKNELI